MMKKLHKRNTTLKYVEPGEGERKLLCSNESGKRSPSLDLINTKKTATEDDLIKYLAGILVEGFLWHYEHADIQQ